MNREEHEKLSREIRMVGKAIPREMLKKTVSSVNPQEEQKYKLKDALQKSPSSFPKNLRRNIMESLDRGDYDKKKQVMEHKYDQRMDEIVSAGVKKIIEKHGGLDRIRREVARDPFILENNSRFK